MYKHAYIYVYHCSETMGTYIRSASYTYKSTWYNVACFYQWTMYRLRVSVSSSAHSHTVCMLATIRSETCLDFIRFSIGMLVDLASVINNCVFHIWLWWWRWWWFCPLNRMSWTYSILWTNMARWNNEIYCWLISFNRPLCPLCMHQVTHIQTQTHTWRIDKEREQQQQQCHRRWQI